MPIPDKELTAYLNGIYNWFKKWRDSGDAQFMEALSELDAIVKDGMKYPVVYHLYITFVYELSARQNNGYTKTMADKLITLIRRSYA